MQYNDLSNTMDALLRPGTGFLAADESITTIGKRFEAIGVENTAENRSQYRTLLATTSGLGEYINGVILFEETFQQTNKEGRAIVDLFREQGIIPGIKVDKGLTPLANTLDEKITEGLDGLSERLRVFKEKGAQFAKWRNVYNISAMTPSLAAAKAGAETLARYAACCQAHGIVPIVEPEILMDGDHAIDEAADAAELVLHELFNALFVHQVALELMILKPSMITCGKAVKPFSTPEDVASYTLHIFRNHVPAAVPSINFLSGGQTPEQAVENLRAMNQEGDQPWLLSFSYGRALQEECLRVWQGQDANINIAQAALLNQARLNSKACLGE